jgi:hypothetical protein
MLVPPWLVSFSRLLNRTILQVMAAILRCPSLCAQSNGLSMDSFGRDPEKTWTDLNAASLAMAYYDCAWLIGATKIAMLWLKTEGTKLIYK